MRTRFFPADPPGDDDPGVDVVPERDPSTEPPRDELAAVLPVSEVVGRGDDLVIAVAVANVYSDGVELQIERRVRRGGRDDRGWHETQMEFAGHWGPSSTSPDRLRWGVELADGQRLYLDERFTPPRERHAEGHTLAQTGGGGSGGGDDYRITEGLWLWPLPPEGPLQIVMQWPAFGVGESRVTLDATRIRALAASVQPLWG